MNTNNKIALTFSLFFVLLTFSGRAQSGEIYGIVKSNEMALEYVTIMLDDERIVNTDSNGFFIFKEVKIGHHDIVIKHLAYKTEKYHVDIVNNESYELNVSIKPERIVFDELVVTGTKTFKRQTNSAVIVNVVDNKTLENVQACNLSEGLKFQPGLRVETDCQTCNYTQVRMNGLAGGYSQILINGRPIFSPLTGLYGLEQIPVNMIDRVEVIRGGGSSLYGSSAIGGTVNVLTKIPNNNSFSVNSSIQNINSKAVDFMLNGNASLVSKSKKSGVSFFLNKREREAYDHNEDNFSEIPEIKNTSLGISTFFLPTKNQKIEFSISNLNEYRYGGEMVEKPAYLALQSEERTHNVWMSSADYQINFNDLRSSLISYVAWQRTNRDHYTGIVPDESDIEEFQNHLHAPPYGKSLTKTWQGGIQLNHKVDGFLLGSNVLTLGAEHLVDDTFDEINTYNYLIDQVTKNSGAFLQSDWEIFPSLNLLSGIRMDKHNLVNNLIFSPRLSLLYKLKENTQFRMSYGTGFRAPQAFDTDLHIAFAGGGVSRVLLSPNLLEERSKSFNASINYDKPTEHWVAGFTVEGFYTNLSNAFTLIPIGEDDFGELFEKRNGQGATVQGATMEMRANFDRKIQIESGLTLQSSKFHEKVEYIEDIEGIESFIRTPDIYGFGNISITPNKNFNANINYLYTGSMIIPHFAGAPNQSVDEIITSDPFSEISIKLGYTFTLASSTNVEIYGGVKNLLNSYQTHFDIGKNRDSNFVFGPAQPRTFYLGLKWFMN